MTVTVKNIIPTRNIPTASTILYTADEAKCVIDKFTVTNNGTENVSFDVYLNGSSSFNQVINSRTLVPDQTYLCPEIIGQVLESGDTIRTKCTTSDILVVSAAGREIT